MNTELNVFKSVQPVTPFKTWYSITWLASLCTFLSLGPLFWFPCSAVLAKPVAGTSLEEAIDKAPLICLAETTWHEFQDLEPGITTVTTNRFFLATRYRILKVFRDTRPSRLALGQEIELRNKSNTCLVYTDVVRREGDFLRFTHPGNDGKESCSTVFLTRPGEKVVLFLEEQQQKLVHYGWFISPIEASELILENIQKGLKKP